MKSWHIDELAPGEELRAFRLSGADEGDAGLDQTVLDDIGRLLEIPPNILKRRYAPNYGASASALAEFELYMAAARDSWGQDFAQPIYVHWLRAAWCHSEWRSVIKPSLDIKRDLVAIPKEVAV